MVRRAALALLPLLLSAAPARACAIPVFRFALENWTPAAWRVVVFHRGPLDESRQEPLRRLRLAATSNLTVIDVDLAAQPEAKWLDLQAKIDPAAELPLLAIQAGDADPKLPPAWTAPLTGESVEMLLESPKRREITTHLARGETAVLLLLEGGDPVLDDAAARLLAAEQPRMELTPLPEPSPRGTQPRSTLPLKVAFSVARLSRRDPREAAFVRMLLASDPELEKETGPIVLPIFGRGRLLGGLHGANLTAEELGEVARFLCRECTCELKDLNPGTDLLFQADWEGYVTGTAAPPAADDAAAPPALKPHRTRRPWLWWSLAGACLIAGLTTLIVVRRVARTAST